MRSGSRAWLGGRLLLAGFSWLTALYCFVTSSAFAYQQFIKPAVFGWIGVFSAWHAVAAWAWLGLAIAVLWPDLSGPWAARRLSLAFVIASSAAVVANSLYPVLPRLVNGDRAVVVGIVGLVPVLWLAVIDHVAAFGYLREQDSLSHERRLRDFEGRLFLAFVALALFLTCLYAVLTSLSLARAFEPDLTTRGLLVGAGQSVLDHLLIGLTAFLVIASIVRVARGRFLLQYAGLLIALTALFTVLFLRLIAGAVAMNGVWTAIAAMLTGGSVALTWFSLRVRRLDARAAPVGSALDICLGGPVEAHAIRAGVLPVAAIVPLAVVLAAAAGRFDWDFVVLKFGVVVVWMTALAAIYRLTPPRPGVKDAALATVCLIPLVAHATLHAGAETRHVLDRYTVYNPSFRVAEAVLGDTPDNPLFDRFLNANTGFTSVSIAPISIDFVRPLTSAPPERRPLIFFLVIDSLRSDYVSSYNESVTFTPRIGEFARDSVVFRNAFTRYGGTGLSMPAIWAGSAMAHKQYVLPFAPMNALDKLLTVNQYRKQLSLDHITAELLGPDARENIDELDRGRPEMQFDFCDTMSEIVAKLPRTAERPTFVHTRSLNLHVALVRSGSAPPEESYPGFNTSYAWRVHRMDSCFGAFVSALKARGLYDRSLIVLTSDHGELLGEDGKWGHGYYMAPEVVQIPLIVHFPAGTPHRVLDPDAVSFSTDITPTLYAALGYEPAPANDFMGRSLVGGGDAAARARRRGTYVLAASYGAVYAVLGENGHRLFVADGINGGDRAYERKPDGKWAERDVTEGMRMINQLAIRRYIDELGDLYGVE